MTAVTKFSFEELDLDKLADAEGRVAVVVPETGGLSRVARRLNKLTRGALQRAISSEHFEKAKEGDIISISYPNGMAADSVDIIKLGKRPDVEAARRAGVNLAKLGAGLEKPLLLSMPGLNKNAQEVVAGIALRAYAFTDHKTSEKKDGGSVTVMASDPSELEQACSPLLAVAEGVFLARDLTSEPANVLTTSEFAARVMQLKELGLEIEILDEDELSELGMRALLSVGQGSDSPSKVAIMTWKGGDVDEAPLALVGKGVVFDTGGISIKPSAGMQEMTMDMGGAAVVTGVMKTLATRKAKANVVGLIGLVENMPSGNAYRPGDVLKSMKGDTIEVITTDAEGRLVLCDVMWYAQERFKPSAMIDLATLTGAVIIGLGHDNAGVFSNDDQLVGDFLKAADAEGEGAWRMPLGKGYNEMINSHIADVKNAGGRPAGSCTAAQFLHRFVKEETPWIHLDIAGVASVPQPTTYAPKGSTGWGVMSLNRLIRDKFEG